MEATLLGVGVFFVVSYAAWIRPTTAPPRAHGRNRHGESQEAYQRKYGGLDE